MEILGIVGPWQIVLIILMSLFFFVLPLIALIDIIKNDFNGYDKIIFTLIVLFLPFLGSVLYFIIGSSRKIK